MIGQIVGLGLITIGGLGLYTLALEWHARNTD